MTWELFVRDARLLVVGTIKKWEGKFTEDMLNTSRRHMALGLPSEKGRAWIGWLEMQELQGVVQWAVGCPAPPQGPVSPLPLAVMGQGSLTCSSEM